jgi:hypothetical protein
VGEEKRWIFKMASTLCWGEKVMDLCDVPKIWDFEDEVFCYKGVDSV